MITLVEGSIGSGKSYYVVAELLNNYFKWDNEKMEYVQVDNNVEIFTNIDNFRYGNDLKEVIEKFGGVEKFFTKDVQAELAKMKKIVYAIDECQEYFDRKFYCKPVFNCFQSSRRVGIDVYLITQDVYSVAREIHTLCEHHVKVAKRSFSLFGEFRYSFMSGNEVFKKKSVKPDKRVFMQYRSSLAGQDSHKVKKFAVRYYIYVVLLLMMIPVGGYGFIWLLAGDAYFKKSQSNQSFTNTNINKKRDVDVFEKSVRLVGVVNGVGYFVDSKGKLVKKVKL